MLFGARDLYDTAVHSRDRTAEPDETLGFVHVDGRAIAARQVLAAHAAGHAPSLDNVFRKCRADRTRLAHIMFAAVARRSSAETMTLHDTLESLRFGHAGHMDAVADFELGDFELRSRSECFQFGGEACQRFLIQVLADTEFVGDILLLGLLGLYLYCQIAVLVSRPMKRHDVRVASDERHVQSTLRFVEECRPA